MRNLVVLFVAMLCASQVIGESVKKVSFRDVPVPDYSQASSWLNLPDDPNEFKADVFYVYPTTYQEDALMDITNPDQIAAAEVPLRTQASAFGTAACVYAPLYRQIGKAAFAEEPQEELDKMQAIAESDIENALLYYLEKYNQGRPFVIAGHSQGSTLLISILTRIWGTLGVEDRMIATYIIGWSVTETNMRDNSNIRMCEGPLDFNCFVSYNTVKNGAQSSTLQIQAGAYVTNPLNWESAQDNGALVPESKNLFSVFYNSDGYYPGYYPHFTSAQIIDHGLVCDIHNFAPLNSEYETGSYHADDISLFYGNIAFNLSDRVSHYPIVAYGSMFTISASQIDGAETFEKKPKIYIEVDGKRKTLSVVEDAKDFPTDAVTCLYSQQNISAGKYKLFVENQSKKNASPIAYPVNLSVMDPVNIKALVGDEGKTVTVTGGFFGKEAPTAQLVLGSDAAKSKTYSCKVNKPLPYADEKGKEGKSCMDLSTGASSVTYTLKHAIEGDSPVLRLQFKSGYIEDISL